MSKRFLAFWAYIVEVILSVVVVILTVCIFDIPELVRFVRSSSSDVASNFAVVMLAASLGLFWTFYSKSDSPFVQWLHEVEAFEVYARSFLFSIGIYVLLVVSLIFVKHASSLFMVFFSLWLSILGLINVYGLIKNTYDLMRLNALHSRKNVK